MRADFLAFILGLSSNTMNDPDTYPRNGESVAYAVKSIGHWLTLHPRAVDTVSGIHGYWIDWAEPLPPLSVTQHALKLLQARGELECVVVNGRGLWRKKKSY